MNLLEFINFDYDSELLLGVSILLIFNATIWVGYRIYLLILKLKAVTKFFNELFIDGYNFNTLSIEFVESLEYYYLFSSSYFMQLVEPE